MTTNNILRIVKIWKKDKYIGVMLNNADCVYFHNFGKTIYTEIITETLQKKNFAEFKKDIVKFDWDLIKLEENWINKKQIKHYGK